MGLSGAIHRRYLPGLADPGTSRNVIFRCQPVARVKTQLGTDVFDPQRTFAPDVCTV
jgi:hypothetical protein